jgi:hypothetical protein
VRLYTSFLPSSWLQELLHQRTAWEQVQGAASQQPNLLLEGGEELPHLVPQLLVFNDLKDYPSEPQQGVEAMARRAFALLASRCMDADPSVRPSFADAAARLEILQRAVAAPQGNTK